MYNFLPYTLGVTMATIEDVLEFLHYVFKHTPTTKVKACTPAACHIENGEELIESCRQLANLFREYQAEHFLEAASALGSEIAKEYQALKQDAKKTLPADISDYTDCIKEISKKAGLFDSRWDKDIKITYNTPAQLELDFEINPDPVCPTEK